MCIASLVFIFDRCHPAASSCNDPFAAHPSPVSVLSALLPEDLNTSFSDSQTDEEGLEFAGARASNDSRLSILSDGTIDYGTLLNPQDPLSDYEETLSTYKRRMLEAIEAEQEGDYMQHYAVFELEREQLQAQGKLLTGLKLEVEQDGLGDIITVTCAGGGRFPRHQFKKRQTVTILKPMGEDSETTPTPTLGTAAVMKASEEPPMNPARGYPEHNSLVHDCMNDPSHPHHQQQNGLLGDDETLSARLCVLGFTKGFSATITDVNENEIVMQTRKSRIYEVVEQVEMLLMPPPSTNI